MTDRRFITKYIPVLLRHPASMENHGRTIEHVLNNDPALQDYEYKQAFWMDNGMLVIFQKRE
jgi:hypothetical protein